MAEVFGRQLLADVEVIGFVELLNGLRNCHEGLPKWFNCAQIDGVLQNITAKTDSPPVLEFTSIGVGAGKTHLLYLLTSLAVLPTRYGGKDGCVVIIDTDNSFSVDRLAQQIRSRLTTWISAVDNTDDIIRSTLYHVYIYKPQSMQHLVETLVDLPDYFLHDSHHSLDRYLSFIAIDSASAFYWQTKAEEENAGFDASMRSSSRSEPPVEPPTTYAHLRAAIESASKALQCPVIMTSRHIGRLPKTIASELPRTLRPSLPASSAQLSTLRFIVRRIPMRTLPPGLSAAELTRENINHSKSACLARFECFVEESGLSLRDVQTLRATEDGFYFRISTDGVTIETSQQHEAVEK